MNRSFGIAAFFAGLAAVGWVAYGYIGSNPLALTMTVLIATVYLLGALELQRFGRASASLESALAAMPEQISRLDDWLAKLDVSLKTPVRLRIEGERIALPAPAMTPYLVGLLVLLGMLGTFLGMVVTLNGTVMALETTSDLATMRSALAAPVKGLGLAFGTSVAGVAASATLGLLLALRRRERLQLAQQLDARIATNFRTFSLAHQRRQTLETMLEQARVMPELVATMQTALTRMDTHHEALSERLLAGQERFFSHAQSSYSDLAASVDQSLQRSLREAAQSAGSAIQPLVEATMSGITRETNLFQHKIADQVERQLDGLATRFDTSVTTVNEVWTDSLARQQHGSEALLGGLQQSLAALNQRLETSFERQSSTLLATLADSQTALQADLASADQQRLDEWKKTLEAMQRALQDQWQQAGERTLAGQQKICSTLETSAHALLTQAETQARDTMAEVSRLVDTAAQAPQAAADVIAELRSKLTDSLTRDNALLEERSRIITSLNSLLDAVDHTAAQQRGAIESLVTSSAALLKQAGDQFGQRIEAESAKIETAAAEVAGSTIEAASVGEAFGLAVTMFSEASNSMIEQLQRIEAALGRSTARSDEQLGYFVAQAREIIDLSVSSQQQIIENLQQLSARQQPLASEPA